MQKRPLTLTYIIFYILFWPDTWRIAVGIGAALAITPHLRPAEMGVAGSAMLHLMIAGIGYAASEKLAKGFARFLQRRILKGLAEK